MRSNFTLYYLAKNKIPSPLFRHISENVHFCKIVYFAWKHRKWVNVGYTSGAKKSDDGGHFMLTEILIKLTAGAKLNAFEQQIDGGVLCIYINFMHGP